MPPKKLPLLPYTSITGEVQRFRFDDAAAKKLSDAIGSEISSTQLEKLAVLTNNYLVAFKFESSRQTWHDVEKLAEPWNVAAKAIWELAYNTGGRSSDAGFQLNQLIQQEFATQEVSVTDALYIADQKLDEAYALPAEIRLRLSKTIIQRIAMSMSVAMTGVKKVIKAEMEKSSSAVIGLNAEGEFLLRLARWARSQGFKYGPYESESRRKHITSDKGEPPGPFSYFAAELLLMVDEKFRRSDVTFEPSAVASRIKAAQKVDRKRKK